MKIAQLLTLTALAIPAAASAQVKVALGEGVSIVFPGTPVKMHTTVESPVAATPPTPPRPAGGPPMPVAPDRHGLGDLAGADNWMYRDDRATFTAIALSLRGSHPDLPARCLPAMRASASGLVRSCRVLGSGATAVREDRRAFADGNLMISRSLSRGGHAYTVSYMQTARHNAAAQKPRDDPSADAAGEAFLASFAVSPPMAH